MEGVGVVNVVEGAGGGEAIGVELAGLVKGGFGGAEQAEGFLTASAFEPDDEMGGVPFDGEFDQFEGAGDFAVKEEDAGGEPVDKPAFGGDHQGFFEAIIGHAVLTGEQDIATSEPDVGGIAFFFDGGVGIDEGGIEIAIAGEGDGFGGEEFGFAGEAFEGFVAPEFGFAMFAEFDEHANLADPSFSVQDIEFEDFGVKS